MAITPAASSMGLYDALKQNKVSWQDQGWNNQGTLGANNNPTQIRNFTNGGQNYFAQRMAPGWDMAAAEGTGYGGGIGAAQDNPLYVYKNKGQNKNNYRGEMLEIFDDDFQNKIGEREMNITEGNSWKKALAAAAVMAGGAFALQGLGAGMGAGASGAVSAGGAGVTVGGPMSVGLPVGTALGPAGGAAAGTGGLGSILGGGSSGGLSLGNIIKGVSTGSKILGGLGGGGGSGGGGLGGLIPVVGGAIDADRQGEAADKMLAWLEANQGKMEGYFDKDSPEYDHLWEAMSRKDAAAGRNSQYGPRTAEFMAKVAGERANNIRQFTTGTSRAYADALNQNASKYAGLAGGLGSLFGGSGGGGLGGLGSILDLFGDNEPSGLSGIDNWDDIWQSIGGTDDFIDYGEFF